MQLSQDIRSMLPAELEQLLLQLGQPKYRAKQLFKWLQAGVHSYDEMTDLPKPLRAALSEGYPIYGAEAAKRLASRLDETKKYLFRLHDGQCVESVLMKYNHGYSICVSTQVGCRMGCVFCATGRSGYSRDLAPSEILAQITEAQRIESVRISNVVLMGMGEPLDNLTNVLRFLKLLSHPDGVCIGARHVSVSTCGLVDKIEQLIPMKPQFTLSVSLHAPNDEIRTAMMPVARRWSIGQLLDACRRYADATGRRVTYEYSMVAGVNDSEQCAAELASRLRGTLCHVNLIPINEVEGSGCRSSSEQSIRRFMQILEQSGIAATRRRTLGSDISASCGQLRRQNGGGAK